MGNGTFTGQGNYTTYGSRDVDEASGKEQQHWPSELAEAPNTKKTNSLFPADQNLYTTPLDCPTPKTPLWCKHLAAIFRV